MSEQDIEYWKGEARKAFAERDATNNKLRDLEARALTSEEISEFRTLRAGASKAEDDRKRREGDFDKLKLQLETAHQKAIDDERAKANTIATRFHEAILRSEFGAAVDLFGGGATSRTILDADLAMAALRPYVKVEEDAKDPRGYRVIVTGPDGQVIEGANRSALPFPDAVGKLIELLPNKDRILRGGGKAGSGSPGAGNGADHKRDLGDLKSGDFQDPSVRKAVRAEMSSRGALQFGRAFDKIAAHEGSKS